MGNLAALAALTLYLTAQPAQPVRVVAGPAEDYMPALSAGGEMMAFVSNRAGAPNLWLAPLADGPLQLPRRLTSGTAGDKSPAFSPDGKWLAFVSHATDAEGDLFLLSVTAALRGGEPPPAERLWTLNTVRVPAGVDEAAVRRTLLTTFNLEVGAGLGPLAGKIWRVGLMGASSTPQTLLLFLAALESALASNGHTTPAGAGVAAASASLRPQLTTA